MDLNDPRARPAIVRFERVAVEDKVESLRLGRYVGKDVDMALITPQGTKDIFKKAVKAWLQSNIQAVAEDRLPRDWADHYEKQYEAFKNGQELPLNGTAIRGWGMISPAQQEMIIRCNLPTVEDLANAGGDVLRRLHIGGQELKNKAIAWLAQNEDKGAITQRMAALETKVTNLASEGAAKDEIIKRLSTKLGVPIELITQEALPPGQLPNSPTVGGEVYQVTGTVTPPPPVKVKVDPRSPGLPTLTQQYISKFGIKPHHRMKEATIVRKLAA